MPIQGLFVITRGLAHILAGKQSVLYLGNVNASRDWGYSPEYVEFMWKMLQQKKPNDYVIGTGKSHSVNEFVRTAFAYAGIRLKERFAQCGIQCVDGTVALSHAVHYLIAYHHLHHSFRKHFFSFALA